MTYFVWRYLTYYIFATDKLDVYLINFYALEMLNISRFIVLLTQIVMHTNLNYSKITVRFQLHFI